MVKKYIDFNTGKRKNAANSFEKDFIKLINNSVFGKTMENLIKRISFKLVDNAKDYLKERNRLRDKFLRFSRIFAKFAKLNSRHKKSLFFVF